MAKFKITQDQIKAAEMFKTVVASPIWLPIKATNYSKDKASDGSDLHKFQFTAKAIGNPEIDKYAGLMLFMQYSEKQLGFMGPLLNAIGCPRDADGDFALEDMKDIVGTECDGYVVPDVYKKDKDSTPKKQNKLDDFRPLSSW